MPRSTRLHAKPPCEMEEQPTDKSITLALGQRINALRRDAGLTLEQFGDRCGVSRAMLSSIERGDKSPTLPIVIRIAEGFGMSVADLLAGEPTQAEITVIRAQERLSYRDPETGMERSVLSPAHLDNGMEVILLRLPPNRSTPLLAPYKVSTEKYLVVHEGQLTVYVDGKPHILRAGDSMHFEIKHPYRFANEHGHLGCAFYMVIVRHRA